MTTSSRFCLSCLLAGLFTLCLLPLSAQKLRWSEVESCVLAGTPLPSKTQLAALAQRQQTHVPAWFELGLHYAADMGKIPYWQTDYLVQYDSARRCFQLAIALTDDRSARRYRAYWAKRLSADVKDGVGLRQQLAQELAKTEAMHAHIQGLHRQIERIRQHYFAAETAFDQLLSRYPQPAAHLLSRAPELGRLLDQIAREGRSARDLHSSYDAMLRTDLPIQRQQIFWEEVQRSPTKAKVAADAFRQTAIVLQDLGTWAERLLAIRQQDSQPLLTELPARDQLLRAWADSLQIGWAIHWHIMPVGHTINSLFHYDPVSPAAKLLTYRKRKVEVLLYEQPLLGQRHRSTADLGRLSLRIHEAFEMLERIDPAELARSPYYQDYVRAVFGDEAGIERFKQEEVQWLLRHSERWGIQRISPETRHELSPVYTQEGWADYHGSRIALYPRYVNLDSLFAFDGYAADQLVPLPGGEWIATGYCRSADKRHQDAFVARITPQYQVTWLRRFMGRGDDPATDDAVIQLQIADSLMLLAVRETLPGSQTHTRTSLLDLDGHILSEKWHDFTVPRHWLLDRYGYWIAAKGRQAHESAQEEKCFVYHYAPTGELLSSDTLSFRGKLAGFATTATGDRVLVINFLSYWHPIEKQAVSSLASGYNVLTAAFGPKGLLALVPVFSKESIMAERLERQAGGLLLRGRRGYLLGPEGSISAGQDWVYRLD